MPPEVVRRELLEALAATAPAPEPARTVRNGQPRRDVSDLLSRRVRAYLTKIEPAISGQGGSDKTFYAACKIGPGFDLDFEDALAFLAEYGDKCDPPWTEKELHHKLSDAYRKESARGWLLDTPHPAEHGERKKNGNNGKTQGQPSDNKSVFSDSLTDPGEVLPEPEPWPEPRIFDDIAPPPFPLDVFPLALAELCRQGAEAVQCPVDYFGAAAVGLASAAVGMSVNVRITSTWTEGPNLYLAVVGPPGSGKTPAIKILARPFYDIDRELREQYKFQLLDHQERMRDYESARKRGGVAGPTPIPPTPLHLTMDDVTRESLAKTHAENPRGLVLILDELTAWVASLNAYRGGKGDDKQFWLRCNSGSLVKVNRKGSPEPIVIARPCISIVGGMTPGTLPDIRDDNRNDGWLDRILFAYPEPPSVTPGWTEAQVDPKSLAEWSLVVRRLWARTMEDDGPRKRPAIVRLTPQGRERWKASIDAHRREVDAEDFPKSRLKGPWSKLEAFALRMALILSQLRQAYDPGEAFDPDDERAKPPVPRDIDALDVWDAFRLVDYFKANFLRATGEIAGRSITATPETMAVLRWIAEKELADFNEGQLNERFHRLDERERKTALAWLISRHCIRPRATEPRKPGQPGRPKSPTYDVNPSMVSVRESEKTDKSPPDGGVRESPEPPPKPAEEGSRPVAAYWLLEHLRPGRQRIGLTLEAAEDAGYPIGDILDSARDMGLRTVAIPGEGKFWEIPD